MELTTIRELYKNSDSYMDQKVTIGGWVRSIRGSKAFGFIVVNDGTFFEPLQVVYHDKMDNFAEISKLNVGAAVIVTGTLVATPQAKQPFEIQADTVEVEGASAPDYPLQKKRHSFEYLRTIAHLRPRTNTFQAVFRVRSLTAYAIHKFFQERELTLCAVLTAAALVTFVIELQLPPLTGIPGIKPGLANIFTLFALCWLGRGWAFALMMVRVVLGCLITGRMTALGYSLVGGALAYLVMAVLLYVISERQLWVVSMFGAMAHNLGQMLVARFVAGVAAIWYYLPVLLLSALVTGLFTGLCAQLVLKRLRRGAGRKEKGEST